MEGLQKNLSGKMVLLMLVVLALFVSSIPMLWGYLRTPDDCIYQWCNDQSDQNTYFAKMRTGYRGDWLTLNHFSHEMHRPVLWQPFYTFLGHMARWYRLGVVSLTPWDPPVSQTFPLIFHGVRLVLLLGFCLGLYAFTGLFPWGPRERLGVLALFLFAGGWSFYAPTLAAHTLYSTFFMPHFVLALLAFLGAMAAWIMAMQKRRSDAWAWVLSLGSGFVTAWIHPYNLPTLFIIALCLLGVSWLVWRRFPWRLFITLSVFGLGALPGVAYTLWMIRAVPTFNAINEINVLPWLNPWDPLIMVDGFLLACLAGIPFLWRKRQNPAWLAVGAWMAGGLVAVYLPLPYQRRLIEGWPLALALGTAAATRYWLIPCIYGKTRKRPLSGSARKKAVILAYSVVVVALLPKTLWLIYEDCKFAERPLSYVEKDKLAAFNWLEANSDWRDVVLCREKTGNRLPWFSGNRVYCGHWGETVDFDRKRQWVQRFQRLDLTEREFAERVLEARIQWLLWIEKSEPAGSAIRRFAPEILGDPLYERDGILIYRLNLDAAAASLGR